MACVQDLAATVKAEERFDFLIDIIPARRSAVTEVRVASRRLCGCMTTSTPALPPALTPAVRTRLGVATGRWISRWGRR